MTGRTIEPDELGSVGACTPEQVRSAALTIAEHCPEPADRLAALQACGLAPYEAAPPRDRVTRKRATQMKAKPS